MSKVHTQWQVEYRFSEVTVDCIPDKSSSGPGRFHDDRLWNSTRAFGKPGNLFYIEICLAIVDHILSFDDRLFSCLMLAFVQFPLNVDRRLLTTCVCDGFQKSLHGLELIFIFRFDHTTDNRIWLSPRADD